jgi:hypothetical protein
MGSAFATQPHLPLESSPFRIFSVWPQVPLAEIKIFAGV